MLLGTGWGCLHSPAPVPCHAHMDSVLQQGRQGRSWNPGMLQHKLGKGRQGQPEPRSEAGKGTGGQLLAEFWCWWPQHRGISSVEAPEQQQSTGEGQQCLSWPERDPLSLAPPRLSCKTAAVPSELAQITSLTNSPGAQPLLTAAHTLQGWGTAGPHGTALWALPARLSKAWPGQVQLSRESWAGIASVREAAPAGLLSSYGPAGQQGCSEGTLRAWLTSAGGALTL